MGWKERWRPWAAVAAGFAILALTGCYVGDAEVIGFDDAVTVSGLPGTYPTPDGGMDTIAAVPFSNDYRLKRVAANGEITTGTFRVVPLRANIYLVQFRYDRTEPYIYVFYRFTSGTPPKLTQMEPTEPVDDLAERAGITLEGDADTPGTGMLSGDADAVLDFLMQHKGVALEPVQP